MQTLDYSKLINSVKHGDINAYNTLCIEFLGYVPMIIEDLSALLENSHLDMDDVHQEGYLAICESIQEIATSNKKHTANSISKLVMGNIISHIMTLLREQRSYDEHIVAKNIEYDNFKQFLNEIEENAKTKESCITFILSMS